MKQLGDIFKQKFGDKEKQDVLFKEYAKHPYFKLLDEFYKRINAERVAGGYKPLPYGFFVKRLNKFNSLDSKYAFLKKCQQSSNFSKMFFGLTKKDKNDKANI